MGRTKQLLPFGETSLLGQVVEQAGKSQLHEILVVLGHDSDKICRSIDLSGTAVVINTAYAKGQSTSLVRGLDHVSPACDAAMFLLGDQPLVTPGLINRLIHAFDISGSPIVIPSCRGIRGNPVIIARPLFARLKSLTADTGARVLFDELKDLILEVSVEDDGVLLDADTMADYERLKDRCL
jgi:molybdenum cofactor cytidylyltransferase